MAATAPIAVVHHGGVTDALFRAGQAQRVRDFVKRVKDHGLLAGVSSHCPDHVRRIERQRGRSLALDDAVALAQSLLEEAAGERERVLG